MPRILLVRGQLVTPWELGPWRELEERFEVSYLLTRSNRYQPPEGLRDVPVRARRDLLPRGRIGDVAVALLGDGYLMADGVFAGADIVHAEELSFWFSAEAAKRKRRHGFRLVQTVWETLPHLVTYRNRHARRYRQLVLAETDLFLPATRRAADALRLEGVEEERMLVLAPGINTERFGAVEPLGAPSSHTILSPGRLVWEKGHQDVLRALVALHRGLVRPPGGEVTRPRLLIVGSGPERQRLQSYAAELGLEDAVEFQSLGYEEMPRAFATASAMVLASQPAASASYHPFDLPRAFWEEQFGLVLAEAMAAGLAIVATTNGAIPEVLEGASADLVAPGDWMGMARALAAGPLARAPGERIPQPPAVIDRYSNREAARRLAGAYDRLLAGA